MILIELMQRGQRMGRDGVRSHILCGTHRRMTSQPSVSTPDTRPIIGDPNYNPPNDPIAILHEDDELLIVDKPAGLLSQPGLGPALADCQESRARDYCPTISLVHRLDRDTSGILIFAKNAKTHRHLGVQFERRHLTKRYIAVVSGQVKEESGWIDAPLIADWPNRPMQKICETGKPSKTEWTVTGRGTATTRLDLNPLTGRTHQLRVHLLSIGHPILGDVLYAPPEAKAERLHLHATEMTIRHPIGGAHLTISCSCPF